MTVGRLANLTLNSTANTTLYTVPAGKIACVDLNFYQQPGYSSNIEITIHIGTGTTHEHLYKIVFLGSTTANRWNVTPGVLLGAGETITIKSNMATPTTCTVRGIEEDLPT